MFLAAPCPQLFILVWVNPCSPFLSDHSPLASVVPWAHWRQWKWKEVCLGSVGDTGVPSFPSLSSWLCRHRRREEVIGDVCFCVCANVGHGVWRCCS